MIIIITNIAWSWNIIILSIIGELASWNKICLHKEIFKNNYLIIYIEFKSIALFCHFKLKIINNKL